MSNSVQQYMRETAYKVSVFDIVTGKFSKIEKRSYITTSYGLNINRARIYGIVVDIKIYKQDQNDENIEITRKDYAYFVVDDGTETIRIKVWGDDINQHKIQDLKIGDNVDIIGKVREYNNEIYIMPEIISKISDPNWELLRELEKIQLKLLLKNKKLSNISSSLDKSK